MLIIYIPTRYFDLQINFFSNHCNFKGFISNLNKNNGYALQHKSLFVSVNSLSVKSHLQCPAERKNFSKLVYENTLS